MLLAELLLTVPGQNWGRESSLAGCRAWAVWPLWWRFPGALRRKALQKKPPCQALSGCHWFWGASTFFPPLPSPSGRRTSRPVLDGPDFCGENHIFWAQKSFFSGLGLGLAWYASGLQLEEWLGSRKGPSQAGKLAVSGGKKTEVPGRHRAAKRRCRMKKKLEKEMANKRECLCLGLLAAGLESVSLHLVSQRSTGWMLWRWRMRPGLEWTRDLKWLLGLGWSGGNSNEGLSAPACFG